MDNKSEKSTDLETLTCPITLQVFRDPVIATDGHAYERDAIVKWIEKHGTSPMTREPLKIADLQPDEYLKQLASRRRSSAISFISQHNKSIIPVLSIKDSKYAPPTGIMTYSQNIKFLKERTLCMRLICIVLLIVICLACLTIGIGIALSKKNKSDDANFQTSTPASVQMTYAGQLTSNSPTYNCIDCSSQDHYYEAFLLNVSTSGNYRVSVQSNVNIYEYLYIDAFYPSDPSVNRIPPKYISNNSLMVEYSIYLADYMNYTLIVTSRGTLQQGTFLVRISGPNYVYVVRLSVTSTIASTSSAKTTTASITSIPQWLPNALTVAGNCVLGSGFNQLSSPDGLFLDDNQMMFIADYMNHRVLRWKIGNQSGMVVAGGAGFGNQLNQLNAPIDVAVDKQANSILVCDYGNRRVMQWSLLAGTTQGTIRLSQVPCFGLAIDNERSIYISNNENFEVRRYSIGSIIGILVAGGNGKGANLNQLALPTYLFVDLQQNVYVSDKDNRRVMKWSKGATEGMIVAGGGTQGQNATILSLPRALFTDASGALYVVDAGNQVVLRFAIGSQKGTVVAGGYGIGNSANQFNSPRGLSFDPIGNMYVVDSNNHRVQKFSIQ